jgi:transcriptional regulator with XRE-family HTH domain
MAFGDSVSAMVARLLADARRQEGLSMEELAERAGVHRTYVGLLERSERQPTLAVVASLAEALGLSVSDLVAQAEDAVSNGQAPAVELVPAPDRRITDRAHLVDCPNLVSITGLTGEMVAQAIDSAYHTLDLIDEQMRDQGSVPIGELVELANLSSMLGNLVGAGMAKASDGLYERNGPHKYPDLLPVREGAPGLEIKTALETNRPKGHLAKAGTYLTFRYVLVRDGTYSRGKESRGDTVAIWEVRFGELEEEDFAISNTEGDSGKTANFKKEAFDRMGIVYYDPGLLPYAKAFGVHVPRLPL